MNEKLIATPAGMKWCPEHKKWEHIRIEGDLHMPVSEWHHHYKAHIAALVKMLPGNGGDAKCGVCGNPAGIVTDGLYTEFYCRYHWDWRSQEQDNIDSMFRMQHDPLSEEEKKEFGVEEAQ